MMISIRAVDTSNAKKGTGNFSFCFQLLVRRFVALLEHDKQFICFRLWFMLVHHI